MERAQELLADRREKLRLNPPKPKARKAAAEKNSTRTARKGSCEEGRAEKGTSQEGCHEEDDSKEGRCLGF